MVYAVSTAVQTKARKVADPSQFAAPFIEMANDGEHHVNFLAGSTVVHERKVEILVRHSNRVDEYNQVEDAILIVSVVNAEQAAGLLEGTEAQALVDRVLPPSIELIQNFATGETHPRLQHWSIASVRLGLTAAKLEELEADTPF